MIRRHAFFLIILFLAMSLPAAGARERRNYTVLAMEYIGATDHSFGPIVISDSEQGNEWFIRAVLKKKVSLVPTPAYVVSAPMMQAIISEAETQRSNSQQQLDGVPNSLLTVRITIVINRRRTRYLLNPELAFALLESLKGICKDNKPLQSDLLQFQREFQP